MTEELFKEPDYFIFGNMPKGEYEGSIWDTTAVLHSKEYYFKTSDNLTYKPKPGDILVFKEFVSKKYWGEAVIESEGEKIKKEDEDIIRFRLKNITKWLYTLNTDIVYDRLSNKDTRARIVNITKSDYKIIIKEMEKNSLLGDERQSQLKKLWSNYKSTISESTLKKREVEFDKIKKDWRTYHDKIINGSFELNDYTNILSKTRGVSKLSGGYLCNFLERTTRDTIGSSKPGKVDFFGVKLNSDNSTYQIGSDKANATREEADKVFTNDIKPLITDIIQSTSLEEKISIVEERKSGLKAKQLLRKLIVLDNECDFVHIYSEPVINELYEEMVGGEENLIFAQNRAIFLLLKELLGFNNSYREISLLSTFLWLYQNTKSIADKNNPNVILYGPPGTGKTFSVKRNLDFVCHGDRNLYEIIQFHPSYTYEDFIEGIKPKGVSSNGHIKFELVNGVFKQFCIKAKSDPEHDYYFVVDEVNRANLSSVFGEILLCLEKDYRHKINTGSDDLNNLVKTQYSNLINQLPDPEKKDLSYHLTSTKESYFGVPDNVFFIGMMNDVDKSIDAFDLALRRRFKWVRMDCDYDVIFNETKYRNEEDFDNISDYLEACKHLNKYISQELGLGRSYEFGHSFFMKITTISNRKTITAGNLENLFNLHLRPTLKEYLRAIYAEKDLDVKLDEAISIFKEKISDKS